MSEVYSAIEAILPYAMLFSGILVLAGNDAARRFLSGCGLSFALRRFAGLGLCIGAAAIIVELTSCHVAIGLIGALFAMAASAWINGEKRSAIGSAMAAAFLVPMVVVQ